MMATSDHAQATSDGARAASSGQAGAMLPPAMPIQMMTVAVEATSQTEHSLVPLPPLPLPMAMVPPPPAAEQELAPLAAASTTSDDDVAVPIPLPATYPSLGLPMPLPLLPMSMSAVTEQKLALPVATGLDVPIVATAGVPDIPTSTTSGATDTTSSQHGSTSEPRSRRLRPAKARVNGHNNDDQIVELTTTESLDLSLASCDESEGVGLSGYNALLLQHVELFTESSTLSGKRIGLRCIHCINSKERVKAANFFPSSTSFLSPSVGNIGTRHLLSGICPQVPRSVVERLNVLRPNARGGSLGLDAHCRLVANKHGIVNAAGGGLCIGQGGGNGGGGSGVLVSQNRKGLQKTAVSKRTTTKKARTRTSSSSSGAALRLSDSSLDSTTTAFTRSSRTRSSSASAMDIDDDEAAPAMKDKTMLEKASLKSNGEVCDALSATTTSTTTMSAAAAAAATTFGGSTAALSKENAPLLKNPDEIDTSTSTTLERYTGKPDVIDASSFVPGSVEYFWECKHCSSLPVPWRAAGSVVFSAKAPTLDKVKSHLERCQGLDALTIPRDATISIGYGEKLPPIRISWDGKQLTKKIPKIEKQRAALAAGKPWPPPSVEVGPFLPSGVVNSSVEKTSLTRKSDRQLTAEFSYTTVSLMRKCYLTKATGSRGGTSLGFPGLACSFCAGTPNERRFFYTTADMLRNSFSHIPSHLVSCTHGPREVRENLQRLKGLRSEHKAKLNPRDHKVFIAQVWKRLHSKNIDAGYDSDDSSDAEGDDDIIMKNKKTTSVHNGNAASDATKMPKKVSKKRKTRPASTGPSERQSSGTVVASRRRRIKGGGDVTSSSGSKSSEVNFVETDLVRLSDRHLTTDLAYLSIQVGCSIHNLTSTDVASLGQGEIGLAVLQCRHCAARIFAPRSPHKLRAMLLAISTHLNSCSSVPSSIKTQLKLVDGKTREDQESELKRGSLLKFSERVFARLSARDLTAKKQNDQDSDVTPLAKGATSVVFSEDQALVSEYTFFTLQQLQPCLLSGSKANGGRASFAVGTPGLACRHCATSSTPRTFFFRSEDVFCNNYSHIPNHVLACRSCPQEIKDLLSQKKSSHVRKQSGGQRKLFSTIWKRLERYGQDEKIRANTDKKPKAVEEHGIADAASDSVVAHL